MGATLLVVLCGCSGGGGDERVTVFAASSLTDAFEELATAFETASPGIDVELAFDGSSRLAIQIVEGAPADVFASADERTMATVVDAGLVAGTPERLSENTLVLVTQPGNPEDVRSLDDLARPGLVVVLADPVVPAGRYAADVLERASVEVDPATFEPNVRAVVSRVALGEADVGIAYTTDVLASGEGVDAVPIPPDENVTAAYSIAALTGAGEQGSAFVEFTLGPEGQATLEAHGFGSP